MRPGLFPWAAALTLALLTGPPAAYALTLDEAIAHALQHNADLKVAMARRDIAEAQLDQARAAQFPAIVASGEVGTARTDLGGFFGFNSQTTTPRAGQISLQQPLLALGVFANVDRAKAGEAVAAMAATAARLGLAAGVAEAYVGVQAARQRQAMYAVALEQMRLVDREAAAQFDKGGVSRTELARTKSRIAEVRADAARADGDVIQAAGHFTAMVGVPPEDLLPIGDVPPLPATLDEASRIAAANSPALSMARAKLEAADAAARAARAERLPTISAVAEAGAVRDQFFPGYRTNDLRVGVRGRMTIFSSGQISGRIAEADAARRAATAEVDGVKDMLEANVAAGWQAVISSAAMRDAAVEAAIAADMAYADARAEHRLGARSTAEVLDVQRDSIGANLKRIHATGEAVASVYRLRALIGAQ